MYLCGSSLSLDDGELFLCFADETPGNTEKRLVRIELSSAVVIRQRGPVVAPDTVQPCPDEVSIGNRLIQADQPVHIGHGRFILPRLIAAVTPEKERILMRGLQGQEFV